MVGHDLWWDMIYGGHDLWWEKMHFEFEIEENESD